MIDSIPPEAIRFVQPYLEKAAGKVLDAAGTALAEVGGRLWSRIKARMGKRPAAAEAVKELERAPADADAQKLVEIHLKRTLQQDKELRAFLAVEIEKAQPLLSQVTQTARIIGDKNTVIQVGGDYKQS